MEKIGARLDAVFVILADTTRPPAEDVAGWYSYLARLKEILGNTSNDLSFVATLMAKRYLQEHTRLEGFDAAEKPQGAPGLDLDVRFPDGRRLIAEIKTTSPYLPRDLGAQQKASFERDFNKLEQEAADEKFFFVTERSTFELMKLPKYRARLSGVNVVLLTADESFAA